MEFGAPTPVAASIVELEELAQHQHCEELGAGEIASAVLVGVSRKCLLASKIRGPSDG